MSLDIVVPTVRANASSVRRVAELSVPPAFASLRILIVVDGPQSEEAWLDLRRLEAQHASIKLLSTRPGPHGWPAGASAARNVGIEHSHSGAVARLVQELREGWRGLRPRRAGGR